MNKRDFNKESSGVTYFYNFDRDIMHPFMIKSFMPYLRKGNLLELGSYKGDFTRRLLDIPIIEDITCVEAAGDAVYMLKQTFTDNDRVNSIHSMFETVTLPVKYENIVCTHVLEHLDDPVTVLKRINDEWITDDGHLLLVCPNANAASRQIAVAMGLISHNSAVTPSEAQHGHKRTYSMETLFYDIARAGLLVVHGSGIFFKALANFQWDKLLETDIVSPEYLEGCYQVGKLYPDLCASIFLVCKKG